MTKPDLLKIAALVRQHDEALRKTASALHEQGGDSLLVAACIRLAIEYAGVLEQAEEQVRAALLRQHQKRGLDRRN